MTFLPRPFATPRIVISSWLVFVLTGAALVAQAAWEPELSALQPATLDRYLARVAAPDARDIRVNGVYGSGHGGAWQFVAHVTWRTAAGRVEGGNTTLPQRAGSPAVTSDFGPTRLQDEEDRGWSLSDLRTTLRDLPGVGDPLAMLALEIPTGETGTVVSCRAAEAGPADCATRTRTGHVSRFGDGLTNRPELDALSVQRDSAPVTASVGRPPIPGARAFAQILSDR